MPLLLYQMRMKTQDTTRHGRSLYKSGAKKAEKEKVKGREGFLISSPFSQRERSA